MLDKFTEHDNVSAPPIRSGEIQFFSNSFGTLAFKIAGSAFRTRQVKIADGRPGHSSGHRRYVKSPFPLISRRNPPELLS